MNLYHLLDELGGAEGWTVDLENEITRGAIVLNKGEMLWPAPRKAPPPQPKESETQEETEQTLPEKKDEGTGNGVRIAIGLVLAVIFAAVGLSGQEEFIKHFTVFVLACFIGWQVIWNVSHSLHTPLMSVTNAISGIIIVGGILQLGSFGESNGLAAILAGIAILVAAINIAGGFLVTQRMLAMFRRDDQ